LRSELTRRALALVLLGASACVELEPVVPTALETLVHSVLDVSSRYQYVIVQEAWGSAAYQPTVLGATVTVTLPDSTVIAAVEMRDSTLVTNIAGVPNVPTVYRLPLGDSIPLIPGATYWLRVATPRGHVVTGSTTIPVAVMDTTSGAPVEFEVTKDTFRLSWPRAASARRYEVFVRGQHTLYATFADTSVALPGWIRSQWTFERAFAAGTTQRVVVTAVDVNYFNYYRRSSDFFSGAGPLGHLTGGLGVFGSVVPVAARVVNSK
jgi:hypothetical protein